MGRRAAYQPLGVWLNSRRVGTLTRAATGASFKILPGRNTQVRLSKY